MNRNKKIKLSLSILLLSGVSIFLLGCNESCTMNHAAPKMDIVDTAVSAGDFDTLVTAVQAADLVSTLKGEGPFTVFAPTDQAFAKLPPGTLETLLKPENKQQLASILTYHVVPGKVTAAQVVKLNHAATVNGQSITIKTMGGQVMVDNANVIQTDIYCSNGVILFSIEFSGFYAA